LPDSQTDDGYFSARDGLRLFRRTTRPAGSPTAHVVVLHGTVATTPPLPQNFRLVSATPLEAVAFTSMLLPVHAPLAGVVMLTVGPGPPPVATVTETLAAWGYPDLIDDAAVETGRQPQERPDHEVQRNCTEPDHRRGSPAIQHP